MSEVTGLIQLKPGRGEESEGSKRRTERIEEKVINERKISGN